MIGIAATIIAAVKGRTGFAWAMGIWSAIEILLLLAGSNYTFGPGVLFLIIAISMKNLRKQETRAQPSQQKTKPTHDTVLADASSKSMPSIAENKRTYSVQPGETVAPVVCENSDKIECPKCHTRQRSNRKRCSECGVYFVVSDEPTVVPAAPLTRFCRKCGFQLLNGSEFCSHCGTKVVTVTQDPTTIQSSADNTAEPNALQERIIVRDRVSDGDTVF